MFVVAAAPLLSRIYTPSEFGILGVYAATLYFVASIAALRFDVAIPIAKTNQDAEGLRSLAFIVVTLTAAASGLLVAALYSTIPVQFARLLIWGLPLGVLALGTYNVAMNWRLRTKEHATIARTRVLQAISGAAVQLGFGYYGFGAAGLVGGQIIGVSAGMTKLKSFSIRGLIHHARKHNLITLAKQYRNFAKFDAPAAMLAIANTHAPTIVIAIVASPAAAGFYALVQRVLVTPIGMVSNALQSSLFSHVKNLKETDTQRYVEALLALLAILCPMLCLAALLANHLFDLVFGPQWKAAGPVAAWVMLFLGQKFVFDSGFAIYSSTARQAEGLIVQSMVLASRLLSLFVATTFSSFDHALIAFSLTSGACYFLGTIAALQSDRVNGKLAIAVGALDGLLPYLVVYEALKGGGQLIVTTLYAFWISGRIWHYIAKNRSEKSRV